MTTRKQTPEPKAAGQTAGSNEHNDREHAAKVARDKERLKDPNLNEHDKNEIRERMAREAKR